MCIFNVHLLIMLVLMTLSDPSSYWLVLCLLGVICGLISVTGLDACVLIQSSFLCLLLCIKKKTYLPLFSLPIYLTDYLPSNLLHHHTSPAMPTNQLLLSRIVLYCLVGPFPLCLITASLWHYIIYVSSL